METDQKHKDDCVLDVDGLAEKVFHFDAPPMPDFSSIAADAEPVDMETLDQLAAAGKKVSFMKLEKRKF